MGQRGSTSLGVHLVRKNSLSQMVIHTVLVTSLTFLWPSLTRDKISPAGLCASQQLCEMPRRFSSAHPESGQKQFQMSTIPG